MRFAAAVDVSDHETAIVARSILHTAGFLALGCHGNLDMLYSEREQRDETMRMERAVRLAQLVREFHVGCERLQMFDGAPESDCRRCSPRAQYDLLVLGAVTPRLDGRRFGTEALSSRLVDATHRRCGAGEGVQCRREDLPAAGRRFRRASRSRTSASSSSELMGLLVMRRCASPCISRTADEVSPVTRMALNAAPQQLARRGDDLRAGAAALEVIVGDHQVEALAARRCCERFVGRRATA